MGWSGVKKWEMKRWLGEQMPRKWRKMARKTEMAMGFWIKSVLERVGEE